MEKQKSNSPFFKIRAIFLKFAPFLKTKFVPRPYDVALPIVIVDNDILQIQCLLSFFFFLFFLFTSNSKRTKNITSQIWSLSVNEKYLKRCSISR